MEDGNAGIIAIRGVDLKLVNFTVNDEENDELTEGSPAASDLITPCASADAFPVLGECSNR